MNKKMGELIVYFNFHFKFEKQMQMSPTLDNKSIYRVYS